MTLLINLIKRHDIIYYKIAMKGGVAATSKIKTMIRTWKGRATSHAAHIVGLPAGVVKITEPWGFWRAQPHPRDKVAGPPFCCTTTWFMASHSHSYN